jgi:hypothetical protein
MWSLVTMPRCLLCPSTMVSSSAPIPSPTSAMNQSSRSQFYFKLDLEVVKKTNSAACQMLSAFKTERSFIHYALLYYI